MKDAYETLAAIKKNMADVQAVLSAWAGRPLLTRKPSHTYLPDEFDEEHKANLAARYAEISTEGKQIQQLLLQSNRVLKVKRAEP